jgi:DNA repair exonuclease SbcCD ATPase subunit
MISSINITGFRGIAKEIPFKLGAITLLTGRNGLGKTTLFDAIDWCLFGASWRLGSEPESLRNIYHKELSPTVRIEISLADEHLVVERTVESAFLNGSKISDRDLIEVLMIDPGAVAPYARDVERRLRRVVYLSQEEVRALVHPNTESERVSLFQALLGVPNASVMRSGVRRISEHFRQREEAMRLNLGQLRLTRDELRSGSENATSETVDSTRLILEAMRELNLQSEFTVDELGTRCRQELDRLSAESIRLDDALAAIAAFRERRKTDPATEVQLSQEIERTLLAEAGAHSALDEAGRQLESAQEANQVYAAALQTALDLETTLKVRSSAEQRIAELAAAEEQAKTVVSASQNAANRLRFELELLHKASSLAFDRRRATTEKRAALQNALDRAQILQAHQREEAQLSSRTQTLAAAIDKQELERASKASKLQEAQTEMTRLRAHHAMLTNSASRSDSLEALLRQVASLLPADLNECPLCGTSFSSHRELEQHIFRSREKHAQVSDALSAASSRLRSQQQAIDAFESNLREQEKAVDAVKIEKVRCDRDLERIRAVIAGYTKESEKPTMGSLELIDADLKSIDEDLRRIKNDVDDKTARLSAAEDEVLRASVRTESIARNIVSTRQSMDPTLSSSDLAERLERASQEAILATNAARASSDARKKASENLLTKRDALQSVRRHLADLRSQEVAVRERIKAETATLFGQLEGQIENVSSLDEAIKQIHEQRARIRDRVIVMQRLWSELVVASAEEKVKAIRLRSAAIDVEIAARQGALDQLLSSRKRFTEIAAALEETAELEASDALNQQREAIQECFAAMYPHGHLNRVVIGDEPLGQVLVTDKRLSSGVDPATYLSTGQANVLALSFFLGIALRQRLLRIGLVCLDEPVQHLDDLHFLNFVSLLKRIGLSRQIVLSTADANVAEIITRQMESSWAELPTDFIRYDWQTFDPEMGPTIVIRGSARQAVA